jgi:hypothetical protein
MSSFSVLKFYTSHPTDIFHLTKFLFWTVRRMMWLLSYRWFQGFDWDGLRQRTLVGPIIQQVSITQLCHSKGCLHTIKAQVHSQGINVALLVTKWYCSRFYFEYLILLLPIIIPQCSICIIIIKVCYNRTLWGCSSKGLSFTSLLSLKYHFSIFTSVKSLSYIPLHNKVFHMTEKTVGPTCYSTIHLHKL